MEQTMKATNDYILSHGFEGGELLESLGDQLDDAAIQGSGSVRYVHGYVDPWEETAGFSTLGEFDSFSAEPELGDMLARSDAQESAGDFDRGVIHGDEAADWAALGRRALLKRMDED